MIKPQLLLEGEKMGLRFRKSISLGKGVRLNFGKTGMSISVGGNGFRKTINTKGQVTTSIGIPGTGIYYTETKSLKKDNRSHVPNNKNIEKRQNVSERVMEERYIIGEDRRESNINEKITSSTVAISLEDISDLYTHCDEAVDWTEILVSTSAEDLFMEDNTWKFYKSVAGKVLAGDIDTYLQVIETIRPLDDLLAFGGNFEFGTDNPTVMEIEFNVMPEDVLGCNYSNELLQEYVCACSIRVARDIMALLPVNTVKIVAVFRNKELLQVTFDRYAMSRVNYRGGMRAADIVKRLS